MTLWLCVDAVVDGERRWRWMGGMGSDQGEMREKRDERRETMNVQGTKISHHLRCCLYLACGVGRGDDPIFDY